jgi:hypothetical protein
MDRLASIFLDDDDDGDDDDERPSASSRANTNLRAGGVKANDATAGEWTSEAPSGESGAKSGRATAALDGSASSGRHRRARPRGSPRRNATPAATTLSGWLASLWDALIAEDDEDWDDARRGKGGTPTGAKNLRNIDLGVEQEMEVVLTPTKTKTKTTSGGGEGRRTSSLSGGGGGSGGYFFGDDGEEADAFDGEAEVTSRSMPNVFPGRRVEVTGESETDERATTMQRLWGDPGAYVSADDCRRVLRSLREAQVVCRAMDERMERWVVRTKVKDANGEAFEADDLLEFWRRSAVNMCEVFLNALLSAGGHFESCATTPRHRECLLNVVEGYVLGGLQQKLLARGVTHIFAEDDEATRQRLELVAALPLEVFGLDEKCEPIVGDEELIHAIKTLHELSCPAHMAHQISVVVRRVQSASEGIIGADELLSIFVVAIARAQPKMAHSLDKYIDTFHSLLSQAHKGEGGFAMANFSGALRYATSDAVTKILEENDGAVVDTATAVA